MSRSAKQIWTDDELRIMRENLELQTKDIARILRENGFNRTDSAVKYKFTELGLGKRRKPRTHEDAKRHRSYWQDAEKQILRENDDKTVRELIEILKAAGYERSAKSVKWELGALGLKVNGAYLGGWRNTLCWSCKHSHALGCSWHRRFKPIKGWKAVETVYKYPTKTFTGYTVIECPLYESEVTK